MTAATPQHLTGKSTILGAGMTIVRIMPSCRSSRTMACVSASCSAMCSAMSRPARSSARSWARSCLPMPLRADFEYGIQVLTGRLQVDDEVLEPGTLLYLDAGHEQLNLIADAGCRALLIGGEPLTEPLLMWWNFVARTQGELSMACADWNAGAKYFGKFTGYPGQRLEAPLPPW